MNNNEEHTAGTRLKECMKLRKKTLSNISDWIYSNKNSKEISEQYISQMRTGYRPISAKMAFWLAECLDIDAGYLLGKDDFNTASYEEYLDYLEYLARENDSDAKQKFRESISQMKKYDCYLNGCGYYVYGSNGDGTNTTEYKVKHKGQYALIPAKEMAAFKKDVDKYIRHKMNALMMEHELDQLL